MSLPRHWLLAASTVLLATACATPEERMAKLQLKQQKLELRAEQLAQRNQARSAAANTAVIDQRLPLENVVKALASCDSSFGATVKHFAPALKEVFPISVTGEVASISVPQRQVPGQSTVRPTGEARIYGVAVSAYYDESVVVNGELKKMAWGVYLPSGVDQVAALLGARLPNFKRVSKEINGNYTRMEIFDGSGWHRTSRFDYYRGMADTAGERAMTIEPSRDPAFPGTRVGCSVRGRAMEQLQDSLRPELG